MRPSCTRFPEGTIGGLLYPGALVLAAAFFAGIIGLAVNGGGSRSFEMFMLLGLAPGVTVLFVVVMVILRNRASVGKPHASTAPVLRITSWTDYSIRLECANVAYATALREANRDALNVWRTR